MSYIRLHLILFCLLIGSVTRAASLSGLVANTTELTLYYISNFITGEKTTVAHCTVNEVGQYLLEFESSKLRTYYIDLGSRQAQIAIAPTDNLSLDLPDYTPIRKAEYLNPYFEKENILVYNEQTKDINYYLMNIELTTARQLKQVLKSTTPRYTALSAIDTLNDLEYETQADYLKEYAFYSQSLFFQIANPENIQAIKQSYLREASPNLQNTAFTRLFSAEYHNPLIAPDGLFYSNVSNAIVDGFITNNFSATVGKIHKIKAPAMAELVTVKGFYDAALYAPNYQHNIVQLMLQLEEQLQNTDVKKLCQSSRLKIEQLMVGNPAPYFELFTLKGKKVPTVLKRRNVLLAFVNTNIFDCQKQLHMLEKCKATYKRQIEVVVVTVYQDRKELERFLARNTFENIYFTLWEDNEAILDAYNIKALPTYYLTGKDGKLIYAPLSSPEETMFEELQYIFGY